jgi:hypothetical protein
MKKKTQKGFIDLHGLKSREALELFIYYYNKHVARGLKSPIEVLHGYGSHGEGGEAIKRRIRSFLKRYPEHVNFESGRTQGRLYDDITIVTPQKPLPYLENGLQENILAYCRTRKSEEKIFNKFRSYGDKQVHAAIRALLKSGKLIQERKRIKFFLSV